MQDRGTECVVERLTDPAIFSCRLVAGCGTELCRIHEARRIALAASLSSPMSPRTLLFRPCFPSHAKRFLRHGKYAKSLKRMVGVTGFEPATPTSRM